MLIRTKKQVIVFPKGAIDPKDKERLSKCGYCAVECEDPSKVVLALPDTVISGDKITMAALLALSSNGFGSGESFRSIFAADLIRRIQKDPPRT